mmetsp:Transcript_74465/g.230092  ORF Transcript_74465/g.230092 Transcript_74465/m.230092 type:complete len:97 (-) Transcript_74465:856-1146(-)
MYASQGPLILKWKNLTKSSFEKQQAHEGPELQQEGMGQQRHPSSLETQLKESSDENEPATLTSIDVRKLGNSQSCATANKSQKTHTLSKFVRQTSE